MKNKKTTDKFFIAVGNDGNFYMNKKGQVGFYSLASLKSSIFYWSNERNYWEIFSVDNEFNYYFIEEV